MSDPLGIYLDTNILIRANEAERSERTPLEAMLLAGATRGTARFMTSDLTCSELLVRPYRDRNRQLAEVYRSLFSGRSWLTVLPVSSECLDLAAILRSQLAGMKLPDAIHVAASLAGRCSMFLTADLGINSIGQINHPFGGQIGVSPLNVLRPDAATLDALTESLSA